MTVRLDEARLAERVRARDPRALRAVVETYLPQIFRAARGAGLAPEAAEEVTQATFTTFLETAPRFEGRSHVRTWVFGILYRKLSERRRALARNRETDDIEAVMEARFDARGHWVRPPAPADAELDRREVREALRDCLSRAPERQRLAFLLREVEGFSTEELCKILEVTATNLGVMLYRVRNRLRECLESKGQRA